MEKYYSEDNNKNKESKIVFINLLLQKISYDDRRRRIFDVFGIHQPETLKEINHKFDGKIPKT